MNAAGWTQRHRRSILFLLAMLTIGGLAAGWKLPVALFPNVQFPRIVVHVDAGDQPASQMELTVTQPVETALRAVPGVRHVRSTTSRGSDEVSVDFDWGSDMARGLLQVESAINGILPDLPTGARFSAERRDPTVFPILAYSLTSKSRSGVELRNLARLNLRPLISRVNGVAKVGIQGGDTAEYRISLNAARLNAYGISPADVTSALQANNVLTSVGRVEDHYKLYLAMADNQLKSLDAIRHIVLRTSAHGIVEIGDIAEVSLATRPNWQKVTADGQDAVLVQIYQQPGGNTVEIDRQVRAALNQYKLPDGVKINKWYDQSELITSAAYSVRDAIIIGVILAGIVLFVFLRNAKITLVTTVLVPMVLATAILLLYVLGMSFNIMTLGGMAAAVGLIIDDTLVMFEHIVRRVRSMQGDVHERVLTAAREFTRPLAGSSASTVIIFIPLAFLSGVTGAFFKALSLTMASALIISFIVAWLAVPLLAEHTLGNKDAQREEGGRIQHAVQKYYRRLMENLLRRPVLLLMFLLPLAAIGIFGYQAVGTGFMPQMDEGGFVLDYRAPPGTSLSETDRLLRQVGKILNNTPEVETYSRRTGLQLGGGLTEANEGDFFVRLKPMPRRGIDSVMTDVRQKVETRVPGLKIELIQLMEDLIGDLTAVPQPIEIKLYGDNIKQLRSIAPHVAAAIKQIDGVVDVNDGVLLAGDALEIHVNPHQAALEGLNPRSVKDQLTTLLHGNVTTKVQHGVNMLGLRVWTPGTGRSTIPEIKKLQLRAPDGHLVPIQRIASIDAVSGQPQITRDDLKRMVAVTGRISGRDMGSTVAEVRQKLNDSQLLPDGVSYILGGLYHQQQIAFHGLLTVFAAAVGLVFLLLLFMYERFRVALAIMTAPLLAVCVVFLGLWVTGIELNITAMMGMTMIVGIVTEVAIFYFSEFFDLRMSESFNAALIDAGINRLRPIAMTTIAAILALLPLALGLGQGAQMQQPLAIAIISGLLVQMPLTLIVMPLLYRLMVGNADSQ